MDNFRPTLSRLHYPLEADRMVLRHRRSHNQNGVRVLQILLRCSSAAAPKRCPQTGDGRAMSYAGLIAKAHHPEAASKEFLDQIILFIVQSGAAEMGNSCRLH